MLFFCVVRRCKLEKDFSRFRVLSKAIICSNGPKKTVLTAGTGFRARPLEKRLGYLIMYFKSGLYDTEIVLSSNPPPPSRRHSRFSTIHVCLMSIIDFIEYVVFRPSSVVHRSLVVDVLPAAYWASDALRRVVDPSKSHDEYRIPSSVYLILPTSPINRNF